MSRHVKTLFLDWTENRFSVKEEIERHLQECHDCRSYYDAMMQLLDPGIISGLPRLTPDPFVPARIAALEAAQRRARAKLVVSRLQLSLEGLALLLAVVTGIVLGKNLSVPSPQHRTAEILNIYDGGISTDDVSTILESVLDPLKGHAQ
jgi:predicted anti-sigma-YlaC factor YlaD